MRTVILFLIVILVFVGCAIVGFNIARNINPVEETPQAAPGILPHQEVVQHNFMIVRVDDLLVTEPKLVSVWFVSLFIVNDDPSSLTLAQIYPSRTASPKSLSLNRAFSLSSDREPVPAFWNMVKQYGFNWEGYIMFDTQGANLFLQWLVGPSDFLGAFDEAAKNQDNSRRMAEQTCQSITDSSGRSIGQFDWSQVNPDHFHTSIRLENGLAYWDQMTKSGHPVSCEFLP
ncbi:MAG: hypothetical protein IH586_22545 [Anaerolineaceae bacterium]|nr:hypothetical protein [Anaerolineaceae bacterium]